MASNCIDQNDKITQNALNATTLPTFDSDGIHTFQQVDKLAQDFIDSVVSDQETNPIKNATDRFGELEFYQSLTNLNGYLKDSDLVPYPDLNGRYVKGAIGGIEYADFLNEHLYSPEGINNNINNGSFNLLSQLDSYYKNTFSTSILGGFCKSIQEVFGAIDAFFDLVDAVQGFISDALSFITNIKDAILDFGEKVAAKGLITVLKELVEKVIDEIWDNIKSTLLQFAAEIQQIFENVAEFIDEAVVKRAQKIKDDAETILADENKKTLKDKVKALIDYAVSIFERPGLAEIQFLVLRFCSFISNVEALINEVKRPAITYSTKYQAVVKRLERVSAASSAAAIAAGGIRYTEERRREELERMEAEWSAGSSSIPTTSTSPTVINSASVTTPDGSQASQPADTGATVSADEAPEVDPETGQAFAVPGFPTIITGEVITDNTEYLTPDGSAPVNDITKPKDVTAIETYEDIKNGRSTKFGFKSFDDGAAGWTALNTGFRIHLYKIQALVGKKLIISSGWRSVQTNRKYQGATSSYHLSGLAVDISRDSGLTAADEEKLKIACERFDYQLLGGPNKLGGYNSRTGHWHIEPGLAYK